MTLTIHELGIMRHTGIFPQTLAFLMVQIATLFTIIVFDKVALVKKERRKKKSFPRGESVLEIGGESDKRENERELSRAFRGGKTRKTTDVSCYMRERRGMGEGGL